jgi:2-keto-3-deoxy-L-rhamnonate aldolase RhmA
MTRSPGLKERLRARAGGAPQIGIRSQLCSPIVAEVLGFSGFDYVYIDMEHAPNELMGVLQQCQAIAGTPAVPVVRLPGNDEGLIQRLLDVGIESLVVPMVESVEAARHAVAATRYPPQGIRSAARNHRGNRYGIEPDYAARIGDRLCLTVQLETAAALSRAAAISGVDGVDAVLFGPGDLAADLGHFGRQDDPAVVAAINAAIPKIREAKKFVGMSVGNMDAGRYWIGQGVDFISVQGDLALLAGAVQGLAKGYAKLVAG